jgi:hypothetical protein
MKLVKSYRKPISITVLLTVFILLCFWGNQTPAASSLSDAENNSETIRENSNSGCADFFEQESKDGAAIKKHKKFPWLIAGLGAVAIGVALYFLVFKKPKDGFSNGVLTINGVRYELAAIPAGEFRMGSDSPGASPFERPVHTVRISKEFWMGKTEVTQGLWQAVMGSNPSFNKSGDHYPVENVSWDDCILFIQKLNQLVGGNAFHLPTEAEWEYACRAGTTGDLYGDIDAIAWWGYNSDLHSHPVGQMLPNAWGLYDTIGNVWEWCMDYADSYSADYQIDPCGKISYYAHVMRSCCYDCGGTPSAATRTNWVTTEKSSHTGFRLARYKEQP